MIPFWPSICNPLPKPPTNPNYKIIDGIVEGPKGFNNFVNINDNIVIPENNGDQIKDIYGNVLKNSNGYDLLKDTTDNWPWGGNNRLSIKSYMNENDKAAKRFNDWTRMRVTFH